MAQKEAAKKTKEFNETLKVDVENRIVQKSPVFKKPEFRANDIKCNEIPKISKTENNIINCDGKNSEKMPRFDSNSHDSIQGKTLEPFNEIRVEFIEVIKPSIHYYARARRNMLMDMALLRKTLWTIRFYCKVFRRCIIFLCYIKAMRKSYLKRKQPFFLNEKHHLMYLMKNLSPRFKNKFPLTKDDLCPIHLLPCMKK